jgi:hypothetical protein
MKTLKESLLDDIETTMTNGVQDVVNELINTPKSKLWDILSLSRADAGQKYPLKYENKTLYITRSYLTTYGRQMSLSDAVGAPVDEVVISGGFLLRSSTKDRSITSDNFCKKITCCSGIKIDAYRVNNIDLNIGLPNYNGIRRFPSAINGTIFDGVKFIENVNWESYESKANKQISFHISEIPMLKNCNFNGCNTIRIYSPFLFDGDVADTIYVNWMVSMYEYKYGDNSVKIRNFKKLHAIINNPKKYGTGPVFRGLFKDNIKASDVIPWINDLSDLNHVKICNNSMTIHLFKTLTNDMGFNKYQIETTTVDGWNIILTRD